MTTQARDAYHLLQAQLETIQRIKRAFPEWATNREVWRPTPKPDGVPYYGKGAWVQPDDGVPAQHDYIRDGVRSLRAAAAKARHVARTYNQTPRLQQDREEVKRKISAWIGTWRPRSRPHVDLGPAGGYVQGKELPRYCSERTTKATLTFGHRWWARVTEHLGGDPIIDDLFVVQVEPHAHGEFEMMKVLVSDTSSKGIELTWGYAVLHAGIRSFGTTPEKAISLHRRRAVKAMREKFGSMSAAA